MRIIRALSTQDERIVEELRAVYSGPTPKGGERKPRERIIKIGGALPVGFKMSFDQFADASEHRCGKP
jgi:hypothetical protein